MAVKTTKGSIHAFIVRFWIEPRELENTDPIWRGVIEHVEGKQRLYFDHLDKMNTYFAKYLDEIRFKTENE
jgi:hypothetical protein